MAKVTLAKCRKVLKERFAGVLNIGAHEPNGQVCVRELRAVVLDLPWSDHPDGDVASPVDRACQILNDASWSSEKERTKHCLPLALLSEATAPKGWAKQYAERTIREIVPLALEAVIPLVLEKYRQTLRAAADRCQREGTKEAACAAAHAAYAAYAAYAAADDAAADAAYAARAAAADAADAAVRAAAAYAAANDAAAAYAAYAAAAYAAYAAANDAADDEVLITGVKILLECASPKKE